MNTLEEEIDMTTDEALISALTPKQVGDIELQPFSLMRQVISTRLCRLDDRFFNSVVTVWVCTLSDTEALERTEDASQARLAAFEWAQAQGYSLLNYKPLLDLYTRLNRELEASTRARLRSENGDAPKNVGEPPR
jgi:hypothetical protein